MTNNFIIFSAGRNCASYLTKHFENVKSQTYKNYIHVVVDDYSDDETKFFWKTFVPDERTKLHLNKNRIGKTANMAKYISMHIRDDEDIIVELDLDDTLYTPTVLSKLNEVYSDPNVWCTHSKYYQSDTKKVCGNRFSENVMIDALFRTSKWHFRHLRTYKAFLWNNILEEDLKDKSGKFFPSAADMAVSYPILEMASGRNHHIRFIDEIQVQYNHDNINCDDKLDRTLQKRCCDEIRSKQKKEILMR